MDRERDRRPDARPALKRRLRAPRSLRATRAGWCFIAIIFGVGFAALNTGNNLLYLVLALMLAFLVLSGLLSETSLRGIRIERKLPNELFARGANRIVLRVFNKQNRVPAFAISLEDTLETGGGPASAGRAFALRIGPNEAVNRSYVLEPDARGTIRFDRVRVSTRFPFGLFVKSAELDAPAEALVYPELIPIGDPSHASAAGDEDREADGHSLSGDNLAGLREFVPGDSIKRVHWRRTLRAGRLVVGEREGDAIGEIEVLLNFAPETPFAQQESRISQAASEVVSYLEADLRVGLRSPNVRIPPATGSAHRTELLRYLALVDGETLQQGESAPSVRTTNNRATSAVEARA